MTEGITVADYNAAYIVKKAVCAEYGITLEEMLSKARPDRIAWPRQIAMWACMKLYRWNYTMTGKIFNDKARWTCAHAQKIVNDRMDTSGKDKARIMKVIKAIHDLAEKLSPIYHEARLSQRLIEGMVV